MENFFIFDGENSRDFGVWISGGGTYNAPARVVETEIIPGRNGVVTFDNGRFENVTVTYPGWISKDLPERIAALRAFLSSKTGYKRLEDTYHPDEFRMAVYSSGLEVETTTRNLGGSFDISFDCKPQRFLKSGEMPKEIPTGASKLYNPTRFTSLPLIKATGNGKITIAGTEMTVSGNAGTIYIDCDIQDAYGPNGENKNSLVTNRFPVIPPGESIVTVSGLTNVTIIPRWWTV